MAEAQQAGGRVGENVFVKLPDGGVEPYGEAKVVAFDGGMITVDMNGSQQTLKSEDVLRANPDKPQPDLCNLMILNEATMLDNLKRRYNAGNIYTRAASLLM